MQDFFDQMVGSKQEKEALAQREQLKEEIKQEISTRLASKTKDMHLFGNKEDKTLRQLRGWISDIFDTIKASGTMVRRLEQNIITEEMILEITSLGKIHELMDDPQVSEVMVNAPDEVWAERKGKLFKTDISFKDDDEVLHLARRIAGNMGRRIDNNNPIVDARLPDGSRVNILIPPITMKGTTITIRKFFKEKLEIDDLIQFGTISKQGARFLSALVQARANIVVSGGTGSGKTTTLNIISNFIPKGERITTIEDSAELQLAHDHVVKMEGRLPNAEGRGEITIRDLVKTSLRMRPDRIVVGEIRDGSAFDLLQAMNTGHDGSSTTIHSNSPHLCIGRLSSLVLQAGFELPDRAIKELIADAVDIIVQVSRLTDGSRKITHITEVTHFEPDSQKVMTKDLFRWKETGYKDGKLIGEMVYTGERPTPQLLEKFKRAQIDFDALLKGDV